MRAEGIHTPFTSTGEGTAIPVGVQGHPYCDYGSAVTSHSSQGLRTECVLVNADTRVHRTPPISQKGWWQTERLPAIEHKRGTFCLSAAFRFRIMVVVFCTRMTR